MDLYGYIAFVVGVGMAALIWTPNNYYLGAWVYRLYLCYFQKNTRLKRYIDILDTIEAYDNYRDTFRDSKITYHQYLKAVAAFESIALAILKKAVWDYIYDFSVKKYNIAFLSISFL